jgi:hypothetical protein
MSSESAKLKQEVVCDRTFVRHGPKWQSFRKYSM